MENNNWIPVSSGIFPDDMEDVQVTFIGYNDHAPHCEAFAYRNDEKWYWSLDDCEVNVEITAWKKNCEPHCCTKSEMRRIIDRDTYDRLRNYDMQTKELEESNELMSGFIKRMGKQFEEMFNKYVKEIANE